MSGLKKRRFSTLPEATLKDLSAIHGQRCIYLLTYLLPIMSGGTWGSNEISPL